MELKNSRTVQGFEIGLTELISAAPDDHKRFVARKYLRVNGPWLDDYAEIIKDNSITALVFSRSCGGQIKNYDFLERLDTIEELGIADQSNAKGRNSVVEMKSLRKVSMLFSKGEKIEFSKISLLETCSMTWEPEAEDIFNSKTVQNLIIDEFKCKNYNQLEKLTSLTRLRISNSNIVDLNFLSNLTDLERLDLLNCKKILDFSSIEFLKKLEWLRIDGIKNLHSTKFLSTLNSLEVLLLAGCGLIDSIKPLQNLTNLKAFSFVDNTIIEDGDLSCLEKLPKLSMLGFAPRRHYSHKLVKPWSWTNFDIPDQLVTRINSPS